MIRVVLTGGECTGKSELARALAERFDAPLAREFVRSFAEQRGGRIGFADHGPIARGQMAEQDAAIARARDIAIFDTDLVSTLVYCQHYFGHSPEWIGDEARARLADLYLLMQPDIPWVADGVRDRAERRDEMHALFRDRLTALGARVREIGGSRDERLAAAVDAIEHARASVNG